MTEKTLDQYSWWDSLNHGGMLIAPSRLTTYFNAQLPPLAPRIVEALRRDLTRFQNDSAEFRPLLDTLLYQVWHHDFRRWLHGSNIDQTWSVKLITGELYRPTSLYQHPNGLTIPLFFVKPEESKRIGVGRGRREIARTLEWLRTKKQKLALLTNGQQWRLIYGGPDYEAWCEWDSQRWFEQGQPSEQITALRQLLSADSLADPSPLLNAIEASRSGQAELSSELGERVRKAVELLIQANSAAISADYATLNITHNHLYIAACRFIMRCVIILFAESRDLLPLSHPLYYDNYSLKGLWEQLEQRRPTGSLLHEFSGWPRLLALFQLVAQGSPHEQLLIMNYGGALFSSADPTSDDPIRRALTLFEQMQHSPHDATLHTLLHWLTHSKVKVQQGRGTKLVSVPVDFSDLSSEYIGILYQGLLDFELRQAAEDEPLLFVNIGDQPALPLSRLEAMDDKMLAALVSKLATVTKSDTSEEAEEEGEAAEVEVESEEAEVEGDELSIEALEGETEEGGEAERPADDLAQQIDQRALAWALRAVRVGKLHKAKKADTLDQRLREEKIEHAIARQLIVKTILPHEWFLVRWGGTRKGSGTFYTRPQLGVPLVRRTLQPLAYRQNEAGSWIARPPEQILALKICDSAMGSGSLLAAALRYLTDALFVSLHQHQRIGRHGEGGVVRLADGQLTNDCITESLPVPPDHPDFEAQLRSRLKRYVVERCLYGVDLDPLAVELARLTLWIETMDHSLPFGFLDHKLKCGNALVGCWLDRFQDYPVMAWEREGGDKNHTRFVHHFREVAGKKEKTRKGDVWTAQISAGKDRVRSEMQIWITQLSNQMMRFGTEALTAEALHGEALQAFVTMHQLPVHESEERARHYREQILANPAYQQLKLAFDAWCAIWFWPGEALERCPLPLNFERLSPESIAQVQAIAEKYRFFHWELEFPDVFHPQRAGFDAVIGNPPWDILKPKSQEFFSNIDPLYRTYTKQEALQWQETMFAADSEIEMAWLRYNAHFRAMSNWSGYVAWPFGEADGAQYRFSKKKEDDAMLRTLWRTHRQKRIGYAEKQHPFQYQGSADLNAYKMFLELAYVLAQKEGYVGMIVPSGLSSDKGTGALRQLFLERCRWEWLFGFENKNGIFDIHRSFKFYATIMQKGGQTETIRAAFMRHALSDWEEAERYVLAYPRERVVQFSPQTQAILEIRSPEDLQVLEKIYAHSVLLGDQSERGWKIRYATEFHMTGDSKLFPPRPKWEAQGYIADEYGHWLKGGWQPASGETTILGRPPATILSADGTQQIAIAEVDDVALPLYEGRMIGQFDFSQKGWVNGKGRTAVWRTIPFKSKQIEPQYLMSSDHLFERTSNITKIGFMDITSSTNTRSMIASILSAVPCGHSLPILSSDIDESLLAVLVSNINSFVFDFAVRFRLSGLHMSYFVLEESPILPLAQIIKITEMKQKSIQLQWIHERFSQLWQTFPISRNWHTLWAVTDHERLRLRCLLDAVVAELYGLDVDDFASILRDCDHPVSASNSNTFTRTLDPKGFWRVDKEKEPELRHTVLSLVAFHDLKKIGLEAFLAQNDGDGWMLPATLRLADYGLGHDARAQEAQPVAGVLGPRFLAWQLADSVEESWQACARHAENLRLLLGEGEPTTLPPESPSMTNLFGETVYPKK